MSQDVSGILYLWGDRLSPSEITRIAAISPSKTEVKGEIIGNVRDGGRVVKTGLWMLSSDVHVASELLSDHLAFFVDRICMKILPLVESGVIEQGRILLLISFSDDISQESISDEITPDFLATFGRCKLRLGITVFRPLAVEKN